MESITTNIQHLQDRHDAAWEAARDSSHNHINVDHHHRDNKKTNHGKDKDKGKQHRKKPVQHRVHHRTHKGSPHKGTAHHPKPVGDKTKGKNNGDHHKDEDKDGHGNHNSKTEGNGRKKGGGHIGHFVDGPKHGHHHGKEGGKDGKHSAHGGKHPVDGKKPGNGKLPVDDGESPKDSKDGDEKKGAEGKDGRKNGGEGKEKPKNGGEGKEKAKNGGEGKEKAKNGGEGKEKAKNGSDEEKGGANKGGDKGAAGNGDGEEGSTGKDKGTAHKGKESQDTKGTPPGTKTSPADKTAAPLDSNVATPSQGNQAVPRSPFFTNAGSNIPGIPNHPLDSGSSRNVATPPNGHTDNNNNKNSNSKLLAYTLIPLTIIAGAVYGVVAYRRKNTRRRDLRRRLQEDAEAAALAARTDGGDDDTSSLMSAVSYRPPAPFASEVDVTTESMETNPEIVVGNGSQHLISAPKRDEGRLGDYQDYSHVCQSQILGKKCTNHSISCFVALNHSNGGLNAMALPRTPSAAASRALIPKLEPASSSSNTAAVESEK
ncbi:hypothetical protein KI688_009289 [Linnemannia hyalina]|uniref:Uncharacterized protein n=1 Tax=Linnemannia hyalina TaxID=64524 RepID=A0A9P7Y289_9FUNG|nr:hypothetical protein KI688_009289 [Linnemannia hyalina]